MDVPAVTTQRLQSLDRMRILGLFRPRSIKETSFRSTPASRASASCDSPRSFLAVRNSRPLKCLTAIRKLLQGLPAVFLHR